jgi:hypothetical protein
MLISHCFQDSSLKECAIVLDWKKLMAFHAKCTIKIFKPFYEKDFYSVDTSSLTAGYLHIAVTH